MLRTSLRRLTRYGIIREAVMNVGSVTEIVALYVAYLWGADRLAQGFALLLACVAVNNLLSRGWLWLLKNN